VCLERFSENGKNVLASALVIESCKPYQTACLRLWKRSTTEALNHTLTSRKTLYFLSGGP
jgi:hypothetical protein